MRVHSDAGQGRAGALPFFIFILFYWGLFGFVLILHGHAPQQGIFLDIEAPGAADFYGFYVVNPNIRVAL